MAGFVEQFANKGYMALIPEVTPGVALTPTIYTPLYEEDLVTNMNEDEDAPIVGIKHERFQILQGQRDHQGTFKVLAEPNTTQYLFAALLTQGSVTGASPYTHPFTSSITTDPKSLTVDIANGRHVHRFMGVGLSEIGNDYDQNKMLYNCKVSALAAFHSAGVVSVAGSGPYTITLDTTYDPAPTNGLVAGDLMQLYDVSADAYIQFVVATVASTTTITTSTNVAVGASGDVLTLRPATPSFSLLTPFQLARTEFRISDTAANALTATQTRVEDDSRWTVKHNFNNDAGEARTGGYDPVSLVRTTTDAEISVHKFYDDPQEIQRFLAMTQRALVIRHFSGATGQYELRITINDFRITEGGKPKAKSKELLYHEFKFMPTYKSADSQALDVKVLNTISTA